MTVTRRSVLAGMGMAAAGAMLPMPTAAAASSLGVKLIRPYDAAYATAKQAYNPLFDSRMPWGIAQPVSTTEVQRCIDYAHRTKLPVAARSGGHSYTGNSTPDKGLIVDLRALRGVVVHDDGTASIGPGARLGEVYTALAAKGRALPGGSCPTVGIGGLTLGGGIGVLARKYGLTCDRLVAARVVTGDAVARNASPSENDELFWALRGAGGGNFGIVTSLRFATLPAPRMTVFRLTYPVASAATVFGGWQQWIGVQPDALWSTMSITSGSVSVGGAYVGTASALSGLLTALGRATGVHSSSRSVQSMSYLDAMRHFAGSSARQSFVASSRILRDPVSSPSSVTGAIHGYTGVALLIDALGGSVSRHTGGPFPYRSALAGVQIYASCTSANRASRAAAVATIRDRLGAVAGDTGYVNYLDAGMPDWGSAYYGSNVDRLRAVAATYDPDRVLDFAQNVVHA